MNEKRLEELFAGIRERNAAPAGLAEELCEKLNAAPRHSGGKRLVRAGLRAAAAVLAVLCVSVTALAATLPGFRAWLFGPESQLGDSLSQVEAAGEAEGFRVEVLGVMSDGGGVTVYYTLQDTAGLGRLSESARVDTALELDSSSLLTKERYQPYTTEHTRALRYDGETQTLLCRLSVTMNRHWIAADSDAMQGLRASRLTLRVRVRSIRLREEKEYITVPVPQLAMTTETLPIAAARDDVTRYGADGTAMPEKHYLPVEMLERHGASYAGYYFPRVATDYCFEHFRDESGVPSVVRPSETGDSQRDWLCAAGFLNGELHVQTRPCRVMGDGSEQSGIAEIFCVDAGGSGELLRLLEQEAGNWGRSALLTEAADYKALAGHRFSLEEGRAIWELNSLVPPAETDDQRDEYVFSIGPEELDRYDLVFLRETAEDVDLDLVSDSFELGEETLGEARAFYDVEGGGVLLRRLRVAPLGAILVGTRENLIRVESLSFVCGDRICPCSLVAGDSGYYGYYGATGAGPEQMTSLNYYVEGAPVDLEELTAVILNGMEIPLP